MRVSAKFRFIVAAFACCAAAPALAGGARVVATPVVGCTDRALILRADWLRSDPRYDYDRLMRAALGAGQCRVLDAGLIVVRQGGDLLGGLARVRPIGEPQAVWIDGAALADGEVPFPVEAGTRFPRPYR